ncbi:MAG: hypothetical protein PVG79_08425 [Gemmatimonadales bacterium]|jgi:hypothetical protein
MRTVLSSVVLLPILAWAGPSAAQEETIISVTPLWGFYIPMNDLVESQAVPNPGPIDPETISIMQESGFVWGLRGSRTLSASVWVEVEFQYATSDLKITATRREPLPEPTMTGGGRVITLAGNVLWEFYRAPFTPFGIHLLGGLALVNRGGEFFDEGGFFFDELDGGTNVAAVAGLGFRYGFSRRLGIRVDVRDYISWYKQSLAGGDLDAELQNDIWVTGGLEITL